MHLRARKSSDTRRAYRAGRSRQRDGRPFRLFLSRTVAGTERQVGVVRSAHCAVPALHRRLPPPIRFARRRAASCRARKSSRRSTSSGSTQPLRILSRWPGSSDREAWCRRPQNGDLRARRSMRRRGFDLSPASATDRSSDDWAGRRRVKVTTADFDAAMQSTSWCANPRGIEARATQDRASDTARPARRSRREPEAAQTRSPSKRPGSNRDCRGRCFGRLPNPSSSYA